MIEDPQIMVYMCGKGNPKILYTLSKAKSLLLSMLMKPVSIELAYELLSVDDVNFLIRQKLFRIRENVLEPNFSLITWDDFLVLHNLGIKYGEELANTILRELRWIDNVIIKLKCLKYTTVDYLRFIIVGCYVLDLAFLNRMNMCSNKPVYFVRIIEEPTKAHGILENLYWGCHGSVFGNYVFYTFGNHVGKRKAFPDLVWRKEASEKDAVAVAKALETLYKNGSIDPILVKYGYLGTPYLNEHDKEVISEITSKAVATVIKWFRSKQVILENELKKLRAKRWCEIKDLLIEAWHWIFGWANNVLVKK